MRRRLILALAAVAIAAPAVAAEPPKKDDPAAGLYVDISPVGLPVTSDGRLVNYIFVQVRLVLAPGSNTAQIRTKEPFFRDALVRTAHRSSLVQAGSLTRLDETVLKRTMMAEAAKVVGPRAVIRVEVLSQTPQHSRIRP